MTIQIAPRTKIICGNKEFYCNIVDKDEEGYTVIDWLLDIFRNALPPGLSGTISCNEETKQQIFKAYADWSLYLNTEEENQIRDLRIIIYQKYNSIMLNGVRVCFVELDINDIIITETERSDYEKMISDFSAVSIL